MVTDAIGGTGGWFDDLLSGVDDILGSAGRWYETYLGWGIKDAQTDYLKKSIAAGGLTSQSSPQWQAPPQPPAPKPVTTAAPKPNYQLWGLMVAAAGVLVTVWAVLRSR